MDKTYSETQGEEPFDWNKFLNLPKHTDAEWTKAYSLSVLFTTCAVGVQCAIIPRRSHVGLPGHGPIDTTLYMLGLDFHHAIAHRSVKSAKLALAKIEARSAILIAEELAKLNAK